MIKPEIPTHLLRALSTNVCMCMMMHLCTTSSSTSQSVKRLLPGYFKTLDESLVAYGTRTINFCKCCPSLHLSARLLVSQSVSLSVCVFVCLSVSHSHSRFSHTHTQIHGVCLIHVHVLKIHACYFCMSVSGCKNFLTITLLLVCAHVCMYIHVCT